MVVNGVRLSLQQVEQQLQQVLTEVEEYEGPDPAPIGIMTSDNRRTWAQNRLLLVSGMLY